MALLPSNEILIQDRQKKWPFLGKQGIAWEVFRAALKPISKAYNRQETPLFAKSIERRALR